MQPSADVCSALTVWLIPLQEAQICLLCFQDQITELCGGLLCVCVSLFCWLWQRNESCHGEWCASYSVFRRRSFSDTIAWFSSSYDLEWFPMGRFMFANRLCAGGFSDRPRFTDSLFPVRSEAGSESGHWELWPQRSLLTIFNSQSGLTGRATLIRQLVVRY